jgi:predicted TIM-barrel fold metal-dependent hydrolase
MDSQGIACAILSLSAPGVCFGDSVLARDLARSVNEYTARCVSQAPHRFGFFATLPLPNSEDALQELTYALETLHADGVVLLTNYAGCYLGDAAFERVFAELNQRKAVVFVHPTTLTAEPVPQGNNAGATLPNIPSALLEFVFDTTRAVTNMLAQGTLVRYPEVRFILAHAGGTVPYLAIKIAAGAAMTRSAWETDPDPQHLMRLVGTEIGHLQRLYYDTALSATTPVFRCLRTLVEPSQIVFGSDYPWAPAVIVTLSRLGLHTTQEFDQQARQMVERENALMLFPRFARDAPLPHPGTVT